MLSDMGLEEETMTPTHSNPAAKAAADRISTALASRRAHSHPIDYHTFQLTQNPDLLVDFRTRLLSWYDANKRDMPWRKACPRQQHSAAAVIREVEELDGDEKLNAALGQRGYEVWVSEIMLQQTQVATVIPYYKKWMAKWPTVFDLAKADLEEVNQVWSGLGYYSRAKRLHAGARLVVENFNGRLPMDVEVLKKSIPGVGPYTAGAITSIAFNQPNPLVDGNVIRVVSRLRALSLDPTSSTAIAHHWKLAETLLDRDRPGDFNQAMMEIGATVCTPQQPMCGACPVSQHCLAFQESKEFALASKKKLFVGNDKGSLNEDIPMAEDCELCGDAILDLEDWSVTRYPSVPKKKQPRLETCAVGIVELILPQSESKFLVVQKEEGLLSNLWDFPTIPLNLPEAGKEGRGVPPEGGRAKVIVNYLQKHLQLAIPMTSLKQDLGSVVHVFSHIRRTMQVQHFQLVVDSELALVLPATNIKSIKSGKRKSVSRKLRCQGQGQVKRRSGRKSSSMVSMSDDNDSKQLDEDDDDSGVDETADGCDSLDGNDGGGAMLSRATWLSQTELESGAAVPTTLKKSMKLLANSMTGKSGGKQVRGGKSGSGNGNDKGQRKISSFFQQRQPLAEQTK